MSTEFGHIARLVETVEAGRTPLQENLDRLGATLGKAALAVVALVVVVGLARGLPVIDMFMFGIALAVAVVPEALPAVVTISLAIGVRRMVKRNALVRRLPSRRDARQHVGHLLRQDRHADEERDDRAAGLCRRHRVSRSPAPATTRPARFCDGGPLRPLRLSRCASCCAAAVLASDARLVTREGRWQVEGDPTEGALVVAATKPGSTGRAQCRGQPRIDEIPFTSERRRMTTLHTDAGRRRSRTRRAPPTRSSRVCDHAV